MITSANAGYLFNTTASCTIVNPGGYTRTFTKANTIPALCTVVSRRDVSSGNVFKGLFLVSDNPNAVRYNVSEGITFGFTLDTYTDSNGVVWYSSVLIYYMEYAGSYSGDFIDNSSRIYTADEINALVPVTELLTAAAPVVTPDVSGKLYGSSFVLDAGSAYDSNFNNYYWNILDESTNTAANYTQQNASFTQYYPKTINLTSIDYAPKSDSASQLVGATISGLTTSGTWETLHTVTAATAGQVTNVPITTGHKYVAIRLNCNYLKISVFNVNGTYNNDEVLHSKTVRLDILGTRSWYSNALCLSDLSFSIFNGGSFIKAISAEFNTGNSVVTPTYLNSTQLSNLMDGDSTTECDISWYTGGMVSILCELTYWGGVVNGYSFITSNSSVDADPVEWRLWEQIDSSSWKLLDAVSDASAVTENRRTSVSFAVTTINRETLTYIQSDGSQFIDTGIVGSADIDTEVVISRYMSYDYDEYHYSWGGIISGRQSNGDTAYDVAISQGSGGIIYQYGNDNDTYSYTFSIGTQYTIATQGPKLYVNNTLIGTSSASTFTTPVSMTLFARNTKSEASNGCTAIQYSAVRLYGAKIWKNSTLIRNFVPSRMKGVVGLYDTVSGGFFTSWGAYKLIASDDIITDTFVETDGEVFFNTGKYCTSGKLKCEIDAAYVAFADNPCLLGNSVSGSISAGDLFCDQSSQKFDVKLYYTSGDRYTANVSKSSFSLAPYLRSKVTIYASANGLTAQAYGRTGHSYGYAVNTNPIYLCCAGAGLNRGAKCRIYSVKMWDDDTLILDVSPAFIDNQMCLYDDVSQQPLSQIGGGVLLPTWYIINDSLVNIASPEIPTISEPWPSEYWSFDGFDLINLLNPAKIPSATPPYPYQLWQHFDDGLLTGFCLVNPLVGAYAHSSIRKIEIPTSVKSIGPYAFRESSISAVTIASDCTYYDTSFPPGCRIYTYNEEE